MHQKTGGPKLPFFDVNCLIGTFYYPRCTRSLDADGLLEQMDYYGIEEALITHVVAGDHDPIIGNRMTQAATAGYPRLHPCYTLLPSLTCNREETESFAEEMLTNGVRAVRLFIGSGWYYGLSVRKWTMAETFSVLEEHRMPTLLDYGTEYAWDDRTDWDSVYEIASSFPDLPLILVHVGFDGLWKLYPLLARRKNVGLEFSGNWLYRDVQDICDKFGPERLFFGTRTPLYEPGAYIALVTYAHICEEAKRLIAGGNLRRLMEGVR